MVSALIDAQEPTTSVKLLDLLTNRYHAGIVHTPAGPAGQRLRVQVPASSHFRAGQRVRCILAPHSAGVLAKGDMRRASVLHVEAPGTAHLLLELAFMDDPTAS